MDISSSIITLIISVLLIAGVAQLQRKFFLPKDTILFERKNIYLHSIVGIIWLSFSLTDEGFRIFSFYLYALIPFLIKPCVYFTESKYVKVGLIKKKIIYYDNILAIDLETKSNEGVFLDYTICFNDGDNVTLTVLEEFGAKPGVRFECSSSKLYELDEKIRKSAELKGNIIVEEAHFEKLSNECKKIVKLHQDNLCDLTEQRG